MQNKFVFSTIILGLVALLAVLRKFQEEIHLLKQQISETKLNLEYNLREMQRETVKELKEIISKSSFEHSHLSTNITKKIHAMQDELLLHLYTSNFQRLDFLKSNFSILLWIKVHSFHAFDGIIGCEEAYHDANKCFHSYLRNKKPYFGFWDNDIASDTELLPDVWTHVSFTYDVNSRTGSIFLNEKLDKQRVGMEPLLAAHPIVFGRANKGHNPLDGRYFDDSFSMIYLTTRLTIYRFGSMRILPRSISEEEITSLMNTGDSYRTLLSVEVSSDTWEEITTPYHSPYN